MSRRPPRLRPLIYRWIPPGLGLQLHRLDVARDNNFWSARVNRDIRMIVHRTQSSFMLCYVGHHDEAYRWAERRKLETHPKTGAAQLVEVRETIKEIAVPVYVPADAGGATQTLPIRRFVRRSTAELRCPRRVAVRYPCRR